MYMCITYKHTRKDADNMKCSLQNMLSYMYILYMYIYLILLKNAKRP